MYITVLDELKAAYHELRAETLELDINTYLKLDKEIEDDKKLLIEASSKFPINLSIAEPSDKGVK